MEKFMEKSTRSIKKILLIIGSAVLSIGLCVSIGFNIYQCFYYIKGESYLQSTEEIYIMEAGILRNNLEFHGGADYEFKYNFSHENYEQLKNKYNLKNTAKDGT